MPFGLTIGTERAQALERSIQHELAVRGYSPDGGESPFGSSGDDDVQLEIKDNVMAEYITIMIINNKTAAQITSELEDLIGSEYDTVFTDWLFVEAAKGATTEEPAAELPAPEPVPEPVQESSHPSRRPANNSNRSGLYQQALSQALPSTSQKRSASARSPSPVHPNKIRRTDVPTGPRAMQRDGPTNSRSLIDRVGGHPSRNQNQTGYNDDIQSRIDNITHTPDVNMMMANGFPGMNGMDMNAMAAMAAGGGVPIGINDILMNQMALMQQVLNSGMAFGMQNGMQNGMPMDMNMMNGMQGQQGFPGMNGAGRGRGNGRGRGGARGRGGHSQASSTPSGEEASQNIAAPTPTMATSAQPTPAVGQQRTTYVFPERPQSPTLCKFSLKCTNPHCRWAHPSPVATTESGVVVSTEPCEQGKNCKDKDCAKTHVSPAVLTANPNAPPPAPAPAPVHVPHHAPPPSAVPCRFGAACTRPGCTFSHPPRPSAHSAPRAQPCRYGAGCTRASCPFQHPEGRVLPTSFHRGLSATAPLVNVPTPETGTMGGPSPHKSAKFSNSAASVKEKLEKLEQEKNEMEKDLKLKEDAANKDSKSQVAITA